MQVSHLILKYAACYCTFFIAALAAKYNQGYRLFDATGPAKNIAVLQILQIAGILLLGIAPLYIFNDACIETIFGEKLPEALPVIVLMLFTVIIFWFSLLQSNILYRKILHNRVAIKKPAGFSLLPYFLLRAAFLICYEIFFRGYLLHDSVHYVGTTNAILINIFLYTLLHLPGGKREMIGCIPFGYLLCVLCLWFQSALPAIILHLTLSMAYEINLAFKFQKPLNLLI